MAFPLNYNNSLKNHGAEALLDPMFEMGEVTMNLSLEEKMKYSQGETGGSHGCVLFTHHRSSYSVHPDVYSYKFSGATMVDRFGSKDCAEFINVSRDDALAYPRVVNREYPSTVNERMESAVKPFVLASCEVSMTILDIFNQKLGLPEGFMAEKHSLDEPSIAETRCIKVSASPERTDLAIGPHTDYGSLSFLCNRLGGLQVLLPGAYSEWRNIEVQPSSSCVSL